MRNINSSVAPLAGENSMQRILWFAVILAGCQSATPGVDSRWPAGLKIHLDSAKEQKKGSVIFIGIGDTYDHVIGDWQDEFLRSPDFFMIGNMAEVVAVKGNAERREVEFAYPFLARKRPGGGSAHTIGPFVLVLDAKGELLAGFHASAVFWKDQGSRARF